MPHVSSLDLPPLDYGGESPGQRLARFRRQRGFTQMQLQIRSGIPQTLITDYEHDRLRLSAEMAARFAIALDVSLDEWLLPRGQPQPSRIHQAQFAPFVIGPKSRGSAGGRTGTGVVERLTPQEVMVLGYLERAFTNPEIARETGLQRSTIKSYVKSIMAKCGVTSRRELARDRPSRGSDVVRRGA
jgi:DNA-binding NarL/FixJ family response regulator